MCMDFVLYNSDCNFPRLRRRNEWNTDGIDNPWTTLRVREMAMANERLAREFRFDLLDWSLTWI